MLYFDIQTIKPFIIPEMTLEDHKRSSFETGKVGYILKKENNDNNISIPP